MSQSPIPIVGSKRLSVIGSMFLSTQLPPFIESKEQENFKLCRMSSYGNCLPPSPSEDSYGKWHDNSKEDYFSFPSNYLKTSNKSRSAHPTQAFARLETVKDNNRTLEQKDIVKSPETTANEDNLILQLEDTTMPPMSSSCSTSTSEESDIDDLNQENSTVARKPPVQKHLTRDFDSYVSEFAHYNSMKVAKKREAPSIFRNFF